MGLEGLVVLGLICWVAVIPSLIVGLRLRRAAHAGAAVAGVPRACEGRSRARAARVRNLVDI